MAEVSNKTIVMLLVATVVISIGGMIYTVNSVNKALVGKGIGGLPGITGFALIPNGTAQLTVATTSSIKYTSATVDFGSGNVNTSGSYTNCSLLTVLVDGQYMRGCESFTTVTNGFTVENDGNTNLSVTLYSNISGVTFIGSSGAFFGWNVSLNESNSCYNVTGSPDMGIYPNTTADCGSGNTTSAGTCGAIFENVSVNPKTICPRLRYEDFNDALNIDINVTVPFDAPAGAKYAKLIITGTRAPLS